MIIICEMLLVLDIFKYLNRKKIEANRWQMSLRFHKEIDANCRLTSFLINYKLLFFISACVHYAIENTFYYIKGNVIIFTIQKNAVIVYLKTLLSKLFAFNGCIFEKQTQNCVYTKLDYKNVFFKIFII